MTNSGLKEQLKVLTIRDFTHKIGTLLQEGGCFVITKAGMPYRYLTIRELEVVDEISKEDEEAREEIFKENGKKKEVTIINRNSDNEKIVAELDK